MITNIPSPEADLKKDLKTDMEGKDLLCSTGYELKPASDQSPEDFEKEQAKWNLYRLENCEGGSYTQDVYQNHTPF